MRRILTLAVFTICLLVLFFSPLVINWVYYLKAPSEFFITDLNVADILGYYSNVLSFLGTVILGALTLYQNKKAQEKTDEINQLQLELQKRSMDIAEQQYKKDISLKIPKFDISLYGYSGHYLNPRIKVENVSNFIISNFTYISALVKNSEGSVIRKVEDCKVGNRSLSPNTNMIVDFKMLNLYKRDSKGNLQYYENVIFVFEFSCEDDTYNKHFFRATLDIDSTENFVKSSWNVEKVG